LEGKGILWVSDIRYHMKFRRFPKAPHPFYGLTILQAKPATWSTKFAVRDYPDTQGFEFLLNGYIAKFGQIARIAVNRGTEY
jgi:hypothetical protein